MASCNKVILIGNLAQDPHVWRDGTRCRVSFPLITSETYTDRTGERVTKKERHNVVLWNKLAEIGEKYLHKGKEVFIEGKIETRSYKPREKEGSLERSTTDRPEEGGAERYITEIKASDMKFLGSRRGDAPRRDYAEELPAGDEPMEGDELEGIPF